MAIKDDYHKVLTSDTKRMAELEYSCLVDAAYLLENAIKHIDNMFGKDYSKEHPELVAALLKSATDIFVKKSRKI